MKTAIETGLPRSRRPFEWAIAADNVLYLVGSPIKSDGTPELGGPEAQVRLVLSNMKQILQSAGGTLNDITQAVVYLTSRDYTDPLNAAWIESFTEPYPNRAIVLVNEIGAKDVGLVVVAHAHIKPRSNHARSATT